MNPAPSLSPVQSVSSHLSPDSWTRSATVDFFRGLGLWMIFIDHIEPNIWSRLTLWRFGFSDFAEIFVFLSGFIGVGSFERSLAAGGVSGVLRKLASRIARLYVAHVASLAASLILLAAFVERGLRLGEASMYVWLRDPVKYALRILDLLYAPHFYSLLPLYIVISPVLLIAAIGLRRAPELTLSVSGALWLASQFPALNTRMGSDLWYFDPLAWQFLFVLGAAARYYANRLEAFASSRWTIGSAAFIVAGAAALKSLAAFYRVLHGPNQPLHSMLLVNSGKAELAAYRLVHFLALLVLVHAFTQGRRRWLQSFGARMAIACGIDSLFIYSCSLVLDAGASLILASTRGGAVQQLELTIFGIALLASLAWLRRGEGALFQPGRSHGISGQIPNSAE